MKTTELRLSLKRKWFDMTKTIKGEDYRNITPYWAKRLGGVWEYVGKNKGLFPDLENSFMSDYSIISFKKFDINTLTLGYPSNQDKERIHKREHKGIEIRTGNPEWGAEPDKIYFVIMHGDVINH